MGIWTTAVFCVLLLPAVAARAADAPRSEDVAFKAKCDGTTQNYVLIYPAGFKPDKLYHLLIALHGHGSDRWQFAKGEFDEARAAHDAAAAHDMLFVSPDYRKSTSWMGPKAEADVVQIIDELKARFRIGKVIVCGGSMGGSSALSFAAMHPERTDGVVSMNGTANHLEYEKFSGRDCGVVRRQESPDSERVQETQRRVLAGTVDNAAGHHGRRQGRDCSARQRAAIGRRAEEAAAERTSPCAQDRRPQHHVRRRRRGVRFCLGQGRNQASRKRAAAQMTARLPFSP